MDKQQRGFSLIEVLISVTITLFVMAMVFSITLTIRSVLERESRVAEVSSSVARAMDDVTLEISRAGYGLGEGVTPILPYHAGTSTAPSSKAISIWSNPRGASGVVLSEGASDDALTRVRAPKAGLEAGDRVVAIDAAGGAARAEVTALRPGIETNDLELRSLENGADSERAADRLLALSEVSYSLASSAVVGKQALVKHTVQGARVLTPWLDDVRFDYLDAAGGTLAPTMLERGPPLAMVKVTMRYSLEAGKRQNIKTLTTAVALDRQSTSVDFAEPGYGFRLARYFHPIESPAAVVMRSHLDWGVIVSAGANRFQDPSYLYSFPATRGFLEARVDSLTPLDDVRGPVAVSFGPERGRFAGSLWMATSNLRNGSLYRVHPDGFGAFSPESPVDRFNPVDALSGVVGMAFGADEALYIASNLNRAVYRLVIDADGTPATPETVASVRSSIQAIVVGSDGAVYFVENEGFESKLWRIGFTSTLAPLEPLTVTKLSGRVTGLAGDSLSGALFALMEERMGDTVVVELPSWWLRSPGGTLTELFSLAKFRQETLDGPVQAELDVDDVSPIVFAIRLPVHLIPKTLDFVAFDSLGLMYLASRDSDLVLQFDLDRRDDERNAVGVAAVTTTGPDGTRQVVLNAWKKRRLGT